MAGHLVYQQENDDYRKQLDATEVVRLVRELIERRANGVYGHIYFGPVASTSPVLNFAIFNGSEVFVSINVGPSREPTDAVFVLESSDDYVTTRPLLWGQDRVTIPRALCAPAGAAIQIVEHFCTTGDKTDDPRWRDLYREVEFDLFLADDE